MCVNKSEGGRESGNPQDFLTWAKFKNASPQKHSSAQSCIDSYMNCDCKQENYCDLPQPFCTLKFTHLKWFLCKYCSRKKNTAAELNPKHIWSKINSLGPSFIHTDSSPYPAAHGPGPLINIHFFIFMLEEKKAVLGKMGKPPQQSSAQTHTNTHPHTDMNTQRTASDNNCDSTCWSFNG